MKKRTDWKTLGPKVEEFRKKTGATGSKACAHFGASSAGYNYWRTHAGKAAPKVEAKPPTKTKARKSALAREFDELMQAGKQAVDNIKVSAIIVTGNPDDVASTIAKLRDGGRA